jgi:hypothetical protein
MRKRYIIGLTVSVAALAVGFMVGYYIMRSPSYGRAVPQPQPLMPVEAEEDDKSADAERYLSDRVATVKQDAVLQTVTVYMSCGHEGVGEGPVLSDIVGLNEKQLMEKYPQWRIDEFKPDKVVLIREIGGYCPNHFVIREDNGMVAVYDTAGKLLRDTGIPLDILPGIVQDQIKEGIVVNSQEEVNAILENLDS